MAPMVEIHARLRRRGIPTYIFSNTNELAVGHIRSSYPFFSEFDGYILSYEHGAMKPAAKLYEVVERQTGRRGAEIPSFGMIARKTSRGARARVAGILQETLDQNPAGAGNNGLVALQPCSLSLGGVGTDLWRWKHPMCARLHPARQKILPLLRA